jgi:thioredoxin reductase (NADPH)
MNLKNGTDVVIIGAGPTGLFAVFECGMLGLSTIVIDSLGHIGGQCTALYPEKPIYDIPAHSSILAGDLIEKLEAQAKPFHPTYLLGQQVTHISGTVNHFNLQTSQGHHITAKAIIIAGGAGSFGPNKPPLENLSEYEGTSIFYSIRHKESLRNKNIMIAGGGDSAVDWALALSDITVSVHLVHRRDKFRASPASLDHLKKLSETGKITIHTPYQLKSLRGTSGQLTHVNIEDLDQREKTIAIDILLPFFGLSTTLGPIAEWGLSLNKHTILINPTTGETNRKGIFAIGDIASYEHKLKLILTGFAEAAQTAHAIRQQIYPEQELHFEYSTSKGIPQI